MRIYFAGAIRGGRQDVGTYEELISHLQGYGEVVSEHVGSKDLDAQGSHGSARDIHDRNLQKLEQSDVVVAEVTTPSLGVGYELGKATDQGKQALCLHRPTNGKRLSAMIGGCPDVTVKEYSDVEEAKRLIDAFIDHNNL
ncbi:nucleoside 2-deoxyribosyltransferase [Candidatus Woesearchaeota archaeon]|nr:nucleoside 2-deoxyribosyltransferase [Candidatus Woesearchaeota archaeon]